MQFIILFLWLSFSSIPTSLPTQIKPFPSIDVKTVDGKTVNTKDYLQNDKITIVSFWATWCTPCKRELDAINEVYSDWVDNYNVQLLAITIDDARGLTRVPALVSSKGWEFIVLADSKQELMQTLNFQTIPQTFLLDQNGNIIYTHSGYNPGDEINLEEEIKKLRL
ncbi:MAG: TlpA disulfide reductase family protein [Saprospiraceae bacterium]